MDMDSNERLEETITMNGPPKPRQNPGHWLVKDSSDRRFFVAWALLCIMFVVILAAFVLASRG